MAQALSNGAINLYVETSTKTSLSSAVLYVCPPQKYGTNIRIREDDVYVVRIVSFLVIKFYCEK